jgi:hypothetical protein
MVAEITNFLSAMLSTAVVTLLLERGAHALPDSYDEVASGLLVMLSVVLRWAWSIGQLPVEWWPYLVPPAVAMFRVPKTANGLIAVFLLVNAGLTANLVWVMHSLA